MSTGYDLFPRRTPPRHRPSSLPAVIFLLLIAVMLGVVLIRQLGFFGRQGDGTDPQAKSREVSPRGDLWSEEQKFTELYANARKSAVAVYTYDGDRLLGSGSGF